MHKYIYIILVGLVTACLYYESWWSGLKNLYTLVWLH